MGVEKKTGPTAKVTALKVGPQPAKNGAGDEIDEIMGEIEILQQGMADAQKIKAPAAEPIVEPESVVEAASQDEAHGIEEFRGSGDEPSLEDTLGSMKEEPSGPSLLDVPTEAEAETVAEPEEPAPVEAAAEETLEEEIQEIQSDPAEEEISASSQGDSEMTHEDSNLGHLPIKKKKSDAASADGSLTLTLTGNMTLKLNYAFEGQEVTVGFSDHALKVQLSDGTEFKIPVGRSSRAKAA